MRIREAVLADTDCLVEMATRFLAESPYGRLFPADPARLGLLVGMCLELGVIFVAEGEAGAVGMIALVALTDPFGGVTYADEIAWWVDPAHRESVIGPRLLARAQNWTRTRGLAFLKMVAPANTEVGRFYERIGFTAIETSYIKRFN